MVTVRPDLTELEQTITSLRKQVDWLEEVLAAQKLTLDGLESLMQAIKAGTVGVQVVAGQGEVPIDLRRRSNLDCYDEILRDAGRPLHIKEIAAEAMRIGVVWRGTADPSVMVRNALQQAKERFVNVGRNRWTTTNKEDMPDGQ